MTESDRREEIVANWARAVESLEAAELLAQNRHFDICTSRAYYAAFYAATALLLAEGREFSKHSAVVAAIQSDFVRTGSLAEAHGRTLAWLFELRGIADYGESRHVSPEQARRALEAGRAFLAACRQLLTKKGLDLCE